MNPALTYLCDPVVGPGLYVPEAIAGVMRDQLLPMADIATPNPFELSWLTERKLATTWDLVATRQVLRFAPEAQLITSGRALEDTTPGEIETTILGPRGYHQPASDEASPNGPAWHW
nr:bifunctional hydroxymethylpyrimidine kinase/phosphomethylpyrimidine kinase [Sinorhizobium meliloti]